MREKCRRGPALGKASLAKASESEGPEARLRSPADREVPRGAGTNPVSTDSPPRGSPMYNAPTPRRPADKLNSAHEGSQPVQESPFLCAASQTVKQLPATSKVKEFFFYVAK
ncbi:hypothetical protein PGT21_024565 [Puccinia graminis f. sp. tritici]|uniref:Uncharacterized protein n=1 Tax=Puccinia graminis f. sp. tritici TaxID=56615 RepID=A0A5B0QKP1_PUCGR|nr:hypothetical protein PGT21_024565 [Puccinia graminis f. sp. tritici]KAA1113768.1 hypothetical protein PGTUg99_017974 [Puccinia graminis f. sp. tritici]